jgi:YEATS family/TIR domain
VTLRIAQSSRYRGTDRWEWSVWLKGSPAELDTVESVTWFMHPTFPNPVQTRTNREEKFRLDSTGWGEFEIRAEIVRQNGRTLKRSHKLVLEYPAEPRKEARRGTKSDQAEEAEPLRVFVASSVVDTPVVAALRETLETEGFRPDTGAVLDAGVPVAVSVEEALRASAAVIAVFSDRTSPWVIDEVNFAKDLDVPILPVVVGKWTKLPPSLEHIAAMHIDDPDKAVEMAPEAVERIRALIS